MVPSERPHNTYEEDPEESKEISQSNQGLAGQLPTSWPGRSELLRQHESNLRYLVDGIMSPRIFVLPMPYPPSRTPLQHSTQVYLKEVRIYSRQSNEILVVRTIVNPYVHSSSISIVEDEHGAVARLTIYNIDDSMNDPVFPVGMTLAIKQPCWSTLPRGGYHICVDHPSDIIFVDTTCDMVPSTWKDTANKVETNTASVWKAEGDNMFLEKNFRKALEW
jgi:hypothetical protein